MKFNAGKGFTIIEFMVTLAVSALLLVVAVPGFYGVIQNNKAVSMTNKLSATFNFARTEAIRRGVTVSVCSAGNAAFTACGSAANWVNGWVVFSDADGNNAIDSTNDLLKVHEALPTGTTVVAGRNLVSYNSSGFVSNNAFSLTVSASGCYGKNARVLSLSPSGRLSISYISC